MSFFGCLGLCIVGTYFFAKKMLLNKGWKKVEMLFWAMFIQTVLIRYDKVEISQLSEVDMICFVGTFVYFVVKCFIFFKPEIKIEVKKRRKEKLMPGYIKKKLLTGKGSWLVYISMIAIAFASENNNVLVNATILLFILVYIIIRIVYRGKKIRCLHYVKLRGERIQVAENTEKVCFQIQDIVLLLLIIGAGILGGLNKVYVSDMSMLVMADLSVSMLIFFYVTYQSIMMNNICYKVLALLCASVYNFLIVFCGILIIAAMLGTTFKLLETMDWKIAVVMVKNIMDEIDLGAVGGIFVLIGYFFSKSGIYFWGTIVFSVILSSVYVGVTPVNQLEKLSSAIQIFEILAVVESCIQFQITHMIRLKIRNWQFEMPGELTDGVPETFIKYIEDFSQNGIDDMFFGITIVYIAGILAARICLRWRKDKNERMCKKILDKMQIEGKITDYERKKYYYLNGNKLILVYAEKILKLEKQMFK